MRTGESAVTRRGMAGKREVPEIERPVEEGETTIKKSRLDTYGL